MSKIRLLLGLDQVQSAISGAAPIAPEILKFMLALGIPVTEVWGMSECSCIGTANPPDAIRIGTVGKAIPGVQLKLAGDGELLLRGPIVMKGYRNDPARTAEAIDPGGWLHTGDLAAIDEDGYVTITGRKKELIINAAGKNMSPAAIESAVLAASLLIAQVVAVGDRRPFIIALIALDPDAAAAFAAQHGITDPTPAILAAHPGIRAAIGAAVEEANGRLSGWSSAWSLSEPRRDKTLCVESRHPQSRRRAKGPGQRVGDRLRHPQSRRQLDGSRRRQPGHGKLERRRQMAVAIGPL